MIIGNVELSSPFLLAPLAGITDAPTRLLASELGAALTYSEMVSCKGLYYKDKNTGRLLATLPGEGPVAYQLFGSEPDMLQFGTRELAGRENVLYDINMGCPVPKVVKNGEGSALLKNPGLVNELVAAAVEGASQGFDALTEDQKAEMKRPKPVTVKIRMGFDDEHINAVEVAQAAVSGGAKAVAVHGRTREQYYSGKADWDIIRSVKESVNVPVIGNGDIYCGADALAMMAHTGCDAVMIARGALGNPWIFSEAMALWKALGKPTGSELYGLGVTRTRAFCQEVLDSAVLAYVRADEEAAAFDGEEWETAPQANVARGLERRTLEDKVELMLRHFKLSLDFKGEYAAVREMRKHVGWYLKGEHGSAALRREVNSITEAAKLEAAIKGLLER